MKLPVISVIVPVYNTEKYLDECIQSILSQTFTDFELLLVDDGSTDGSGNICDKYAIQDERVKVFHQENQGVTSARRKGLENAKGEYVCFVDSDDTITVDALEILLDKMDGKIDVVVSDSNFERIITGIDFLNYLLVCELPVSLWGKLYKKTIFQNTDIMNIKREIYMGEDYLANMKIALCANSVYCLSKSIYQYRDTPLSVSHTRQYSLEYEGMFRYEVEKILNKTVMGIVATSWYKFQLRMLMGLIINNVKFSYDIPWIKHLLSQRIDCKLSRKEWVTSNIHNASLCRFIFERTNKIMTLLYR